MKKIYRHIVMSLGLLLTLAACTDDRLTDTAGDEPGSIGQDVYVSLVVAADNGVRSRTVGSPAPGEDGDGSQDGTDDENAIADLNVFFFDASDEGIDWRPGINADDGKASNTLVHTFYTDELVSITLGDGMKGCTTGARKVEEMGIDLEIGKTYDVLVLANYGADYGKEYTDSHGGQPLTLAALRDAVIDAEPVTTDDNGQSAAGSSTDLIIRNNRFLMSSAEAGSSIAVTPNTDITPATVTVALERLAARVDYHVLPDYPVEVTLPTASTGGKPVTRNDRVRITHAVLCNDYTGSEYLFKRVSPRISTIGDWNAITPIWLGDETTANNMANNYVLDPKTVSADKTEDDFLRYYISHNQVAEEHWTELIPDESGSGIYRTLAYTRENVSRVTGGERPETALYVVFKAEYIPAEIDGTANTKLRTFYWYHNKAYSTTTTLKEAHSGVLGSADLSDEARLTDYGIRKYNGGICYYTYYIRHADDGDLQTESPMEHATVRNNVYRLDVQSVSGPGGSGDIIVTVTPAPWKEEINVYPDF